MPKFTKPKPLTVKQYAKGLLAGCIGLLALCALSVILIDPAFQYHEPLSIFNYAYENERYQNAGFAKSLEYDTVVIGSSLTSTYNTDWFDETFDAQTIKLSFPGGTFEDFDIALNTVFEVNPDVERIFVCMDPRLLKDSPASTGVMPDYLWDTDLWNDTQYLWNKDVLIKLCVPTLLQTLTNDYVPLSEAFVRENTFEYGLQKTIASYNRPVVSEVEQDITYYDEGLAAHWEIIDDWVNEHPDITFYFYYPPYSTLFWDTVQREGEVLPTLALLKNTAIRYMYLDNVNFYSFLDDNEITTIFDNYTDMVHYSPEINQLLVERMSTEEPMDLRALEYMTNDILSLLQNYDFESVFPDDYATR